MTYFNTPYKYGRKTKNEIDNISKPTLNIGDNVFNTDINKEEFWTGNSWINDDCIEVFAGTIRPLLGYTIQLAPGLSNPNICQAFFASSLNSLSRGRMIGVLYRFGLNNCWVVAIKGCYPVYLASTLGVTRQHIITLTNTPGEAASFGAKTAGAGSFGVIAESFATVPSQQVNCWIQPVEIF